MRRPVIVDDFVNNIRRSIEKFNLNLTGFTVLTEAASGNYIVTPLIAAASGAAKVFAYTKDSRYGCVEEVKKETNRLAERMGITNIEIITSLEQIDLTKIDILTNTGFLRPINKHLIQKLSSSCVIPLMWEPWEYRPSELDIEACLQRHIKVYGTNEDDKRLRTKEYIGFVALHLLLSYHHTPLSSKVLILGCSYFTVHIENVLSVNGYDYIVLNSYDTPIDTSTFHAIIIAEHYNPMELIGPEGFIKTSELNSSIDLIHICGNINVSHVAFRHTPKHPASFGYMSYTADYMGSHVVCDLHAAGLYVAQGMLKANKLKLPPIAYKKYLETTYPALAFKDERYW